MPRNTSNLIWNIDFNSPNRISFDRYLKIGDSSKFVFDLSNSSYINHIDNIYVYNKTNSHTYKIYNINQTIPYSLRDSIQFPPNSSINPTIKVEGSINGIYNYFELTAIRPIIVTNFHPIYDTRLARSNSPEDILKINSISQFLNKYGFDCSTLGIEVQGTVYPNSNSFMECEKEWASGGDCFIAILTKRYNTSTEKIAPNWVYAEDGLSYAKGRPRFVFVERGVSREGSYKLLDNHHVIEFDPYNIDTLEYERDKIIKFRNECQNNQLKGTVRNLGVIGIFTLTILGGLYLGHIVNTK